MSRNTTGKDYKREYLNDFIGLTGIKDLTLQDVYGAMVLMVRQGTLAQKSKSLWSIYQFRHLYRKMADGDDYYNNTIEMFKNAVKETRYDRTHRPKKQDAEDDVPADYSAPEEDMDAASKELLRRDEVFYDKESAVNESEDSPRRRHSEKYTAALFEDFL